MMQPMPPLDSETFITTLRTQIEHTLHEVAEAINNAPDGQVIDASEEQVRELFATLRQQAYQLGLQMRIEAAQAAFSPPDPVGDR